MAPIGAEQAEFERKPHESGIFVAVLFLADSGA